METLSLFLGKDQAGIIGTYIIRSNMIKIITIDKIGDYWLMKLDCVSRRARADIHGLIGDIVQVEDDTTVSSDPTAWGCF